MQGCVQWNLFAFEKISASGRAQTRDGQYSRPALTPLSYRWSWQLVKTARNIGEKLQSLLEVSKVKRSLVHMENSQLLTKRKLLIAFLSLKKNWEKENEMHKHFLFYY